MLNYLKCVLMETTLLLRINIDLAIFQPYLDLEASDNQSPKIQVARPGIKPRSSCSASQELNHSATAAPNGKYVFVNVINLDLRKECPNCYNFFVQSENLCSIHQSGRKVVRFYKCPACGCRNRMCE